MLNTLAVEPSTGYVPMPMLRIALQLQKEYPEAYGQYPVFDVGVAVSRQCGFSPLTREWYKNNISDVGLQLLDIEGIDLTKMSKIAKVSGSTHTHVEDEVLSKNKPKKKSDIKIKEHHVEFSSDILEVLKQSKGKMLSKSDIMEKLEIEIGNSWMPSIKYLLKEGQIIQSGTKRGAKYGLPGTVVVQAVKPTSDNAGIKTRIMAVVKSANGISRGDVLKLANVSDVEWTLAIKSLVSEGHVRSEGKKRGTKWFAV